jgi:hypothetical protein
MAGNKEENKVDLNARRSITRLEVSSRILYLMANTQINREIE